MQKILAVLMSAWLGAQLTIGYAVAPVLFRHLPKMVAGDMAGILFGLLAYAGLVIWLLVGLYGYYQQKHDFYHGSTLTWISIMWVLQAVSQWVITPVIVALKTGSHYWLSDLISQRFALWHGISSSIYLVISLIGLYLVGKLLRMQWH